jgi:NAD(P)-dependent dehydrogenase (short-subunit alcohol dehydrogenase family)
LHAKVQRLINSGSKKTQRSDEVEGTSVFITGGGQGIGKAVARLFIEKGARVTIAEIDEEAGQETVQEYAALGQVRLETIDVAEETAVKAAVSRAVEQWGGLDVLINNAATGINIPITELQAQQWQRVLDVNLTGPFYCAKHAAPHLKQRRGSIVNIGSTRALMSEPDTEAYSATKGGILALTHSLAVSLGPDVRVNCISPGWIDVSPWKKRSMRKPEKLSAEDHRQHPVGRVGKPEDVAALALFLASEEAGFITGQNFIVDGGMTRKMIYAE